MRTTVSTLVCALALPLAIAHADMPIGIAVDGEAAVVTLHAQGAQVYECKADAAGTRTWQFREPIATLMADGQTVGRHYAGPTWELSDGSTVTAKVVGRAPGATVADIPLLELAVTASRGSGRIAGVTTIQRLATRGGVAEGPCSTAGLMLSVAYSADYAFHRKPAPAAQH